jgi:hypothetical protein
MVREDGDMRWLAPALLAAAMVSACDTSNPVSPSRSSTRVIPPVALGRVGGTVRETSPTGLVPVQGAIVHFCTEPDPTGTSCDYYASSVTGADGRYSFEGIGRAYLSVQKRGYRSSVREITLRATDNLEVDLEIEAAAPAT